MKEAIIGPSKIPAELRRDVDIICTVRNMSIQDYLTEALTVAIDQDKRAYPVGYQAIHEAQRRLEEEVSKLRKSA
jgi:hypothetical protein